MVVAWSLGPEAGLALGVDLEPVAAEAGLLPGFTGAARFCGSRQRWVLTSLSFLHKVDICLYVALQGVEGGVAPCVSLLRLFKQNVAE